MHAVRRKVLVAAAASGIQSITFADFATMGEVPKGVRIYATAAEANASDVDEARWSDYFVDSAESTVGVSDQAEHNSATTDTDRYGANDGTVVAIVNAAATVAKRATFRQWVDGGMEIQWTASVTMAVILHVEFLFGDQVQTFVGDTRHKIGDPDLEIDCGFLPDHIETISHVGTFNELVRNTWERHVAHIVRSYTATTPDDLGVDGDHISQELANGRASGWSTAQSAGDGVVAFQFAGAPTIIFVDATLIASFYDQGFKVNSSGASPIGTNTPRFGFLAIRYGRYNRVAMQRITSPTSTGVVSYDFGWEPWVIKSLTQNMVADSSHDDNASSQGLGYADLGGDQSHACTLEDHGAATTDTQSRSDNNRFMRMSIGDGTTVTYECDVDSWDPCGVTLDFLTVDGTARRCSIIALEKDRYQGCGRISAPFPSSAGSGLLGVVGSASAQAPFPTASASGILEFRSVAGSAVAPFPSVTAQGLLGVLGSASAQSPFPAVSARGRLKFHAAGACVRAPFPVVAAIGLRGYIGVAQVTVPFPGASGAGTLKYSGSGSAVAPFPIVVGSGLVGFIGSASITAPFPAVIAGGCTHVGGVSEPDNFGFALVQAPFPGATAAGKLIFVSVSGSAVAPFPGATASGKLKFIALGSITAPFPGVASLGFLVFIGAGSIIAPFPGATASGRLHLLGQSTVIAPFPGVTAGGTTDIIVQDACAEIDLVAEYALDIDLNAEYDAELDLNAVYDSEVDLNAEYSLDEDLAAEYDGEVDLTALCE